MNDRPRNLHVQDEPDYRVRIVHENGHVTYLQRNSRSTWKRLSAICWARYFAARHPDCMVHVELTNSC